MARILRNKIRVDLLDSSENKIDNIQGDILDISMSISNDRSIRRNVSVTMKLLDKYIPNLKGKIWVDRKVQIFIGTEDIVSNEITWYNKGKYVISNPSLELDKTKKIISFEALDYMSLYDGTLGGSVGTKIKLEPNTPFNDIFKASLKDFASITNYKLEENNFVLPYTIEKSPESTLWDLWKEMRDLYMSYEIFFDENGIFTFRKIKKYYSDEISYDFSSGDNKKNIISYSTSADYSSIKNHIVVYGNIDEDSENQLKYELKNTDVKNPFSIGNINRDIIFVVVDEKLYKEEQLKSRAEYEMDMNCNNAESVSLSLICDFNIDVNKIIYLKEDDLGIEGKYLVDSISYNFKGGTMNLECHKIYI